MRTLDLVLLIVGAVCFLLVAANVPSRINLIGLGLLAWILVPLITLARARG